MMKQKKEIQPLPFYAYTIPFLLFVATGLTSCIYLSIVHFRTYTDPTFSSICAISKTLNCDTVAQSPQAILFSLPVAHWGALLFSFILFLTISALANKQYPFWTILFWLGVISSLVSIYYGYTSAVKIHAYCIFCIFCYCSFFGITFYSYLIIQRFKIGFTSIPVKAAMHILFISKVSRLVVLGFCLTPILLIQFIPPYWEMQFPPTNGTIKTGITQNGSPWIGAETPQLTIHEFTDYLCFSCYRSHSLLRTLVYQHPETIRLVHHHFPLDHKFNPVMHGIPFHIGSGQMALIAIQATKMGDFWQVNDLLFMEGRKRTGLNIRKFAKAANLDARKLAQGLSAQTNHLKLQRDITQGLKAGITSTPAYVVNEKTYQGYLPAELFINLH